MKAFHRGPLLAAALAFAPAAQAADPASPSTPLTEMSIEDLMGLEITSVSKREEKLSDAPAAVFVLTQEDIRRSGWTTIPDALRMVPGLDVAKIDANKWAISARGFNEQFANKLLVLIDGRSVYTPLFSGVYWDIQDLMLEDVERIEVIRGPGATLWGANAVNGVINIITKKAKDTQGLLATALYGNEEEGTGAVRYGAQIGDRSWLRVYGKYFNRDAAVKPDNGKGEDAWDQGRGGFRLDADLTDADAVTLQGDLYYGHSGQHNTELSTLFPIVRNDFSDDVEVRGGNLLGRWGHRFSETAGTSLQMYYDRTDRLGRTIREARDTFDLDFQNDFSLADWNSVVWGAGYRVTRDRTYGTASSAQLDPATRTGQLVNGFLQDESVVVKDLLRFIVGSKFEWNSYTGFEIQPSARAVLTPFETHTLWASVSRAVRTPSRADTDLLLNVTADASQCPVQLPFPPFVMMLPCTTVQRLDTTRSFGSEALWAYEMGWRWNPLRSFSVDVAGYYNDYQNLRTLELTASPVDATGFPVIYAPIVKFGNKLDGQTYGVEVTTSWSPVERWKLIGNYSLFRANMDPDTDSVDPNSAGDVEKGSPTHQASLRSLVDLPYGLELDTGVYWVDNIRSGISRTPISSYWTLNARLGWHVTENLELAVVGQNAQEAQHDEFGAGLFSSGTDVERSVFGQATFRY